MLTSIDVKFILDSARLGSFSSAIILQLANVALRVVFLLFLPYSWNEWNVRRLCFQKPKQLKNSTQPHPQVFSVNIFKLPVGGNLYSLSARLLGDFPTTFTPSKLYAHFKFNIN